MLQSKGFSNSKIIILRWLKHWQLSANCEELKCKNFKVQTSSTSSHVLHKHSIANFSAILSFVPSLHGKLARCTPQRVVSQHLQKVLK